MRDWEAERKIDAALVEAAHERAEAAEAAVEQLAGDIHAVSQDYTDLRARLRDLRDQWQQAAIDLALEAKDSAYCKEKQAYSGGKSMGFQYAANNVAALLVDPLPSQE